MKEKLKTPAIKNRIILLLFWLIWPSLTVLSFYNIAKIKAYYPAPILRYDNPITNKQAISARNFSAQKESSDEFWPSFYSQSTELVKNDLKQTQSTCLWYSGSGNLVWPAKFITGAYPGELAENTMCVSTALAWELWGDYDVTGLTAMVGGEEYSISGVFKHSEALALISCGGKEPPPGGWQAAQLQTMSNDNLLEKAKEYAVFSGLGTPNNIIMGTTLVSFLRLFIGLPLIILLICILLQIICGMSKKRNSKRGIIIFVTALVFAFCLPWLLSLLPDRFIPNQWSDYSFWGRLFDNATSRFVEWLALKPLYMDIQVKLILAQQTVVFFGLIIICLFLCYWSSGENSRKSKQQI